jgi:hypothetical protein
MPQQQWRHGEPPLNGQRIAVGKGHGGPDGVMWWRKCQPRRAAATSKSNEVAPRGS